MENFVDLTKSGHEPARHYGKGKKLRVSVTTEWLAFLKCSYLRHFSTFSKSRTKICHKIPAPVWKLVYADFVEEMRNSCLLKGIEYSDQNFPSARNLQDQLRKNLDNETTGNSDQIGAGKATLQAEDVLNQLKATDSHARRNMIQFCDQIITNKSNTGASKTSNPIDTPPPATEETSTEETSVQSPPPEASVKSTEVRPETRASIQTRAADSLDRMTKLMNFNGKRVAAMLADHKELSQKKLAVSIERLSICADKLLVYKQTMDRKNSQSEVYKKSLELSNLRFLLDNNVINQEEFTQQAKSIFLDSP